MQPQRWYLGSFPCHPNSSGSEAHNWLNWLSAGENLSLRQRSTLRVQRELALSILKQKQGWAHHCTLGQCCLRWLPPTLGSPHSDGPRCPRPGTEVSPAPRSASSEGAPLPLLVSYQLPGKGPGPCKAVPLQSQLLGPWPGLRDQAAPNPPWSWFVGSAEVPGSLQFHESR